ncbi:hypothetical protein ACFYTG_53815, partial [Streptomyces mirabilis]|uniref:hypothetical protein n=1 Tax=Streptomyces mirabilis TaxID=68239 RepID=UPI0036B6F1BE
AGAAHPRTRAPHHHQPSARNRTSETSAGGSGLSVSAWLSRAAEHAAKIEAGPAAAAEAMAYVDPPTPDEQAWVDDFMNRVTQPTHTAEQSQGAA